MGRSLPIATFKSKGGSVFTVFKPAIFSQKADSKTDLPYDTQRIRYSFNRLRSQRLPGKLQQVGQISTYSVTSVPLKTALGGVDNMNMNIRETDGSISTLDLFLVKLAGKYSTYSPGDIIFSEGDRGRTMLLILGGSVKIVKRSLESDQPVVIATRSPGELIGEMALVEESPRFATVIAETDCQVLEVTKKNFEKIISEQPSFATRVLESLSVKLRESDWSRIRNLEKNNQELKQANERLSELNAFLDSVIDQSPSAILLATKSGDIFRTNKAALRIFGLKKDCNYKINDLFSDFSFADCRRNLRDTWSGEVKGLRIGDDFPAFLSCTILTKYKDEMLYLLLCHDFTDMPGFDSIKTSEEKIVCAQQSTAEFANEFLIQFGILRNNISALLPTIPQNDSAMLQAAIDAVNNTIHALNTGATHFIDTREADSDFAFVDLRIVLKALIGYCQSKRYYENIEFGLKIDKDFPRRLSIKEIPVQNVIFTLINATSAALLEVAPADRHSITITLSCSPDENFAELQIIPASAALDAEKFRSILNTYSVFGSSYIDKIINYHNGAFLISNDSEHNSICTIRLPLRPVPRDA